MSDETAAKPIDVEWLKARIYDGCSHDCKSNDCDFCQHTKTCVALLASQSALAEAKAERILVGEMAASYIDRCEKLETALAEAKAESARLTKERGEFCRAYQGASKELVIQAERAEAAEARVRALEAGTPYETTQELVERIAKLADDIETVCALYARDCTGLVDSRVELIRARAFAALASPSEPAGGRKGE